MSPVSAFETNHSVQVRQYVAGAPCSTTFVAPIVAPTLGAMIAAASANRARSGTSSSRSGRLNAQRNRVAATAARVMLATSDTSTHERLQCGQLAAKCVTAWASTYQPQSRRGDSSSAAVNTAYGGKTTALPMSG